METLGDYELQQLVDDAQFADIYTATKLSENHLPLEDRQLYSLKVILLD